MSGLAAADLALVAFVAAVTAFVLFCLVVGTRRWREVRSLNDTGTDLARQAIADRRRILAILEDIKGLLERQQSGVGR